MRKIDLHIHTKSSIQDKSFDFCEDTLERYVLHANLDCIAITNHNLFDQHQFERIASRLRIPVLPGIEVDVEGCHLLVLADGHDIPSFAGRCKKVEERWDSTKLPLTYDQFSEIFDDLSSYILIPHYLKEPRIRESLLDQLSSHIYCGEVSSPKKFLSCINNPDMLVPVFFSDCRITASLSELPTKQTYLNCGEISFGALRQVLRDKSKVALSDSGGNAQFQIFPDGQVLSSGLNVILGDRSSGKSHTLQKIYEWFGEANTRYIRQFELVSRNEAEDERRFKDFLSESTSLFSRDYLADLQAAIQDVLEIDLDADERSVSQYIESLVAYAKETSRHDAFSRAKLFSEDIFTAKDLSGLVDLISSVKQLVSNVEYRELIERHLLHENLKSLYVDLMLRYCDFEEANAKKDWVNNIISEVKAKLQRRSSATVVVAADLLKVATNKNTVKKFEELVKAARTPKTALRKKKGSFQVVAQVGPFSRAGELKELSRSARSFAAAFEKYGDPYRFLQELRRIGSPVDASDFSRYMVKVEYRILNRDGLQASGGERSEFFLLDRIEGAGSMDALLIDEPESSFDNHFLKAEVNTIIKEMSKKMPVVVVTHNNTVGVTIRPDFLLYTKKYVEGGELKWRIYSGHPTSKVLVCPDGAQLSTRDVLLGNLEAGSPAYEERRSVYEDLKN